MFKLLSYVRIKKKIEVSTSNFNTKVPLFLNTNSFTALVSSTLQNKYFQNPP